MKHFMVNRAHSWTQIHGALRPKSKAVKLWKRFGEEVWSLGEFPLKTVSTAWHQMG